MKLNKIAIAVGAAAFFSLPAYAGFDEGLAAFEAHDYATAFNEWKPLADQGQREAQYRLGELYLNGQGVLTDAATAISWYEKAAAQGQAHAQAKLGMIYSEGKLVPANPEKALAWYVAAAGNGDVEAQINLAALYSDGKGNAQDATQALRWMEQAAKNGNPIAQSNLGLWYNLGKNVKADPERSRYWYLQSATQGDAQAQYNLAFALKDGVGGPVDLVGAMSWLHKAADQNSPEAQCALGNLYAMGQGIPRDYAQAVFWYQKAADHSFAKAQANLGLMYRQGTGVPQDSAMAARYYQLAAGQGMAEVQTALGSMYSAGQGVKQDYAKAMKWFRKAADQGDLVAFTEIGVLYENGSGVPRDEAEAEAWYRKAADKGYREGQDKLTALQTRRAQAADPQQPADEKSELFALAREGNLVAFEQALSSSGQNINDAIDNDTTLLNAAIETHHFDIAKYLVEHGADVNHANSIDSTPVLYAAYYDMPDLIPLLVQHGADINHRNNRGLQNALFMAANTGNLKVVQTLLQYGADPNLPNSQNVVPLTFAITGGHKEMARLLLEHGTRADVVADTNESLLRLAAATPGWSDIVQELLAHGAKCGVVRNGYTEIDVAGDMDIVHLLRQCIEKGTTKTPSLNKTLVNAARKGSAKFVGELIDAGTNFNGASAQRGEIPLVAAMQAPNALEVVQMLIEKGADPNRLDGNGVGALHQLGWQYKTGMAPVVDYLVKHGADVNLHADLNHPSYGVTMHPVGNTPLHFAVSGGRREYVQALLANGAQLEAPGVGEKTPLAVAIDQGRTDIAVLLLAHGADIDAKGHDANSPLSLAVKRGQSQLVEFVLQHGADVNYRVVDGNLTSKSLPLRDAAEAGHLNIVKLLLAHGADPSLGAHDSLDSPLRTALFYGQLDVVRAFFEKKPELLKEFDLAELAYQTQDEEMRAYLLVKAGKKAQIAAESEAAICRRVAAMENAGKIRKPTHDPSILSEDGGVEPQPENWEHAQRATPPQRIELNRIGYNIWRERGQLVALSLETQFDRGRQICTFTTKGKHVAVADGVDRLLNEARRAQSDPASFALQETGLTRLKQLFKAARRENSLRFWDSEGGRAYLLLAASFSGRSDIVRYLLSQGVSPNHTLQEAKPPEYMLTDKLLQQYRFVSMHGPSATPLLLAAQNGNEDCVLALLAHGADPNRKFPDGFYSSALAVSAVPAANASTMRILLQHGALPATVGSFQLNQLIDRHEQEAIRLLLDFGLDRIDVGLQDAIAMQTGDQNRANPDAVDMILRMHPAQWKAACHGMRLQELADNCLPGELRDADAAEQQANTRALEKASEKNRAVLAQAQSKWAETLQKTCHLLPKSDTRDGWYASILDDRAASICSIGMMRQQEAVLRK